MAKNKVVRLTSKMDRAAYLQCIRDAVEDTSLLYLTTHAKQRMSERDISVTDLIGLLKHGRATNDPFTNDKGDWEIVIRGSVAGRTLGVVLAVEEIKPGETVVVVTTYQVDSWK